MFSQVLVLRAVEDIQAKKTVSWEMRTSIWSTLFNSAITREVCKTTPRWPHLLTWLHPLKRSWESLKPTKAISQSVRSLCHPRWTQEWNGKRERLWQTSAPCNSKWQEGSVWHLLRAMTLRKAATRGRWLPEGLHPDNQATKGCNH